MGPEFRTLQRNSKHKTFSGHSTQQVAQVLSFKVSVQNSGSKHQGGTETKKDPRQVVLAPDFRTSESSIYIFTSSYKIRRDSFRLKRKSHGGKAVHNRDISLERSIEFQSLETQLIDFNDNQYFTFDIDSANKSQSYEH